MRFALPLLLATASAFAAAADTQPPVITKSSVKNNGGSVGLHVAMRDNVGLKEIKVFVDGELVSKGSGYRWDNGRFQSPKNHWITMIFTDFKKDSHGQIVIEDGRPVLDVVESRRIKVIVTDTSNNATVREVTVRRGTEGSFPR